MYQNFPQIHLMNYYIINSTILFHSRDFFVSTCNSQTLDILTIHSGEASTPEVRLSPEHFYEVRIFAVIKASIQLKFGSDVLVAEKMVSQPNNKTSKSFLHRRQKKSYISFNIATKIDLIIHILTCSACFLNLKKLFTPELPLGRF